MNTVTENIKPPFSIVMIDLLDANHYADVFEEEDRYTVLKQIHYSPYTDLQMVKDMADRLFWALNPTAKTQHDWIEWEAGYDVRVYDADSQYVYKAHEKLPQ